MVTAVVSVIGAAVAAAGLLLTNYLTWRRTDKRRRRIRLLQVNRWKVEQQCDFDAAIEGYAASRRGDAPLA